MKFDGTVYAWGANTTGQVGDGTNTERHTAVQVSSLTGVTDIAAGNSHSLAVKSDGTAWAWGWNGYGQLGDDSTTNRNSPVQVDDITGVKSIAGGGYLSLALKHDGVVYKWGTDDDPFGGLGSSLVPESMGSCLCPVSLVCE